MEENERNKEIEEKMERFQTKIREFFDGIQQRPYTPEMKSEWTSLTTELIELKRFFEVYPARYLELFSSEQNDVGGALSSSTLSSINLQGLQDENIASSQSLEHFSSYAKLLCSVVSQ